MTRQSSAISPTSNRSMWQVGTYTALTDTFTKLLDLNDGASFNVAAYRLPQPQKVYARTGNIRATGERITRVQYQNRHITLSVKLLYYGGNNVAALVASVRALINAIEKPPYRIAFALPQATQYTYADVVAVTHNIPTDPLQILQGAISEIQIDFECQPGLAGDRLTVQNLLPNPGFEAPSGPGVVAFNDTFANTNAYSLVAGGAPTIAYNQTYVDIVQADTPLRYFRLDEASGTAAMDIAGQGGSGTYTASPTLGVAGAISGDSDTAVTFNGTTQFMSSTNNFNMPTGTAAITLEAWVKFSANPAALVVAHSIGNWAGSGALYLGILSTGKAEFGIVGSSVVDSGAALSTGVWHHLVGTFSGGAGGTLTLYVDGVSQGTITGTPALSYTSGVAVAVGTNQGNTHAFAGSVDEACVYATALSSARVTAHYNAGHTGATGTLTKIMQLPASAQVAFGSPAWSAINTWSLRFQWVTGLTANFYAHYTDANNYLVIQLLSTGVFRIQQTVAGVTTTLVTVNVSLTYEAWYWLQFTQFPVPQSVATASTLAPYVQATLLSDQQGVPGSQVGYLAPTMAPNATVALTGKPQILASGAALNLGGPFSNVHTLSLFGPGGWIAQSFGTGVAALAWDQTTANTYPNGPVTSFGAARCDLPPAGTADLCIRQYATGFGLNVPTVGLPTSQNHVLAISAWVKSSGLASETLIRFTVTEYDATGVQKAVATLSGASGNQASWAQVATTYTITNAATAYVDVCLRVSDTVTPGASAGATLWWDNAQVYDQTATNATSMPYCELRFPQSPAQLLVSGLVGDIEAPAQVALGTYFAANFSLGDTLTYALGRRAQSSVGAQLVAAPFAAQSGQSLALNTGVYGGVLLSSSTKTVNWSAFSALITAIQGYYHLMALAVTTQSGYANVQARAVVDESPSQWIVGSASKYWEFYGPFLQAYAATAAFTIVDLGQIIVPPTNYGALMDPSQTYITTYAQFTDNNASGYSETQYWQCLLPVDGALLMGQVVNPSNGVSVPGAQWLFLYLDGLGPQVSLPFSWSYSVESGALPNAAHSSGGQGTTTTGAISVNSAADPWLTLDPTLDSGSNANQMGVNQLVGYASDLTFAAAPQAIAVDLAYVPLYLFPR